MKKSFSLFILSVTVCGFIACGNSKSPATEQVATESEEIVEKADSSAIDTTEVVTRGGSESEGFGRCSESGCYCKEFKGRGETCRNCGHAYKRHY